MRQIGPINAVKFGDPKLAVSETETAFSTGFGVNSRPEVVGDVFD